MDACYIYIEVYEDTWGSDATVGRTRQETAGHEVLL